MKLKIFLILTILIASPSGALHAASCQKRSDVKNMGHRFYVEGDLLYWNAHISSLELSAGKGSIIVETEGNTTFMNELDVDPHFKWKAGYRINGGYQFNRSPWALGAIWTHFQDNGMKEMTEEASHVNITKCQVKFNQIDLVVAYDAASLFCVNFKPFLGIRGAKIQENLQAFLVTTILYTPSTTATSTRSLDDSQDYHGIGPTLGLQGNVDLGRSFNLYGTVAAALLYGNYKVDLQDSTISTTPISQSIFSKNQKHLHAFDPNIDLALGIKWKLKTYERFRMIVTLGFEHHQYFNQNHLGANKGDLTFDGGIFGFNFIF